MGKTALKLSHLPVVVKSISEDTKVNTGGTIGTTYTLWRKLLLFPHNISYFFISIWASATVAQTTLKLGDGARGLLPGHAQEESKVV